MKIAVLSDFHFGHAYNSVLENDSFENAEEAMEKALNSDLVLLAGDIFDSRLPRTSVWARAIKVLTRPLLKENTGIKLVSCTKELKDISKRTLNHIPVIALHGTHERRSKGELNAIEALENAGILVHLHQNTIIFEKDGVKVAIHGMSGVPERYAKDVLYQWNPKPMESCFNILILHQSIEPYIYSPLDPPSLSLSNLPKGFDTIIDGHIHISGKDKLDGATMLFPGSTIVTQLEQNEALAEKGFFEIDISKELKVEFKKLEKNRKFFYEKISLAGSTPVRKLLENKIKDILMENSERSPLIKLKISGKESDVLDQELRHIEEKYYGRAIIRFVKELETPEIAKKIEFLRNLREQKLSVEEVGLNILKKNLDELSFNSVFDYDTVFKLLSRRETRKTFNILTGEQKTLKTLLKQPEENPELGSGQE